MVDQPDRVGADRQRRRVGQRRGDAHVVRGLDDARATELGVAVADHDRQAHGDGIDRMGERVDQRHRAAIAAAVIVRAPVADADRRVDHDRVRLHAVLERGGIDVGLERGTGLAHRVGGAVELAGAVVAPAHHGAHRAVDVHQHGRGLAGVIFLAVLAQRIFDGGFRGVLQIEVERGAHHEDALGHRFREGVDQLLAPGRRPNRGNSSARGRRGGRRGWRGCGGRRTPDPRS